MIYDGTCGKLLLASFVVGPAPLSESLPRVPLCTRLHPYMYVYQDI